MPALEKMTREQVDTINKAIETAANLRDLVDADNMASNLCGAGSDTHFNVVDAIYAGVVDKSIAVDTVSIMGLASALTN